MSDKGRRAADRRRELEGDDVLDEPAGEHTAMRTLDEEWVGDDSGLLGGLAEHSVVEQAASQELNLSDFALSGADGGREETLLEATAMAERPRVPAAQGARLLVIAGQDKGRGQDLIFTEVVVGRSGRCDMALRDETASREHIAIRYSSNGFEIIDLGSEGSTYVNGEEVQRAQLAHGDEIEIGETTLRFLISEGPAPTERPIEELFDDEPDAEPEQPEPEPKLRSSRRLHLKKMLIGAALALVVCAVLGGVGLAYYYHATGQVRVLLSPELQALLQRAQAELDAGHYAEALAAAEAFLLQRPRDQEALRIADEARKALIADSALDEIRTALADSNLAKARTLIDQLPADSPARARAEKLYAEAKEVLRTASLDMARKLVDEGNLDAAEKMLEQHEQRFGDDDEAGALHAEIASLRENLADQQDRQHRARINAALIPAQKAFVLGNTDQALQLCGSVGKSAAHKAAAQGMTNDIKNFLRAWQRGGQLHRQKNAGAGLKTLAEASRLDRDIAPQGSVFTQKIAVMRADLLYLTGIHKMSSGDGCGAYKAFTQARALNPGDAKHKEQLDRLAHQAEAELIKADKLKRSDPGRARKLAKAARCMVDGSSTVGRKITQFLKSQR